MELSVRAKERFCKDCNIAIRLFQEPYFTERLKLYDRYYNTTEKWNVFVKELEKYKCEQDYFEEYNRVKDAAILSIKSSEGYQKFNEEDMSRYCITHKGLSSHNIFHDSNDKGAFISIDMKKANFSSLQYYDANIFGGANTWEEFIGRFTNNQHIVCSKYIRQVILGNCNLKWHATYEKFLMDGVLSTLDSDLNILDRVVLFSNDEIVLEVSDLNSNDQSSFATLIRKVIESIGIPLKMELFTLHKIVGTQGYCKRISTSDGNFCLELKDLNNFYMPFVLRKLNGEEITESDKVFYHQGLLSKFIEVPEVAVILD